MDSATARRASNASMSRNSRAAVPGGPTDSQVRPPLLVRSTVPWLPPAQTVLALPTERPRGRGVLPVGERSQDGDGVAVKPAETASTPSETAAIDAFRIHMLIELTPEQRFWIYS